MAHRSWRAFEIRASHILRPHQELGVSRQRVHKLRSMPEFPAPLAELRGGSVWDAAAVRKFAARWERKPGRPRVLR
jgi:hypothetical protein